MISILCYGDSNTWGYQPETDGRLPWDERYTGILSNKLGPEYRVIENGLCGRTTCFDSESEPFVNGLKESKLCAMINDPIDIAVIMLGTNDCKDEYNADLETISLGLEQIAKTFEKAGARIIIVEPPILRELEKSPFYGEFGKGAGRRSEGLFAYYQKVALPRNWKLLNTDNIIKLGEYDKVHLDKEGHQRLAESIYKIIIDMEKNNE